MRRTVLAILLGLLLAVPALSGDAQPPLDAHTRDFDQLHLDIRIEPDLDAGVVEGRVTIEFEALVEGLRRLRLHCLDTRILAVVDGDLKPLAWDLADGVLAVDLAEPLARGRGAAVTISYRSKPSRGLHFHRPTGRHPSAPRFLYSQGQSNENRRWIPCYDLPDDRFSFDVHVTVPSGLETVSNGVRIAQEEEDGDRRRDHWQFTDRAPSYLVSLIVGELATVKDTWRDVTLEYHAVPDREAELRQALGDTPRMLEVFATYLDAPYPWQRYAQTFVWDFVYGGMENVTATTLNMRALHTAAARPNYSSEGLVAHELAHMWFGDLLTCRTWDDIWLNEGFATYLTDIYFGAAYGRDEFLLRRRNQNRSYMDGTPNAATLGLTRHPRGDRPLELFGGKAYNRGAAILHMLRLELGDDTFQQAVRAYVKRFRDRAVSSEEFRHLVEQTAGRNLQWFWDQWVYGAGYPVLDVKYDGKTRQLVIRQTQARKGGQGLFRFTLPVRIDADGPVHRLRIWREHHVFRVPGPSRKREDYVRVGVGGDLLARIRYSMWREAAEAMLSRDPDVNARLDAADALEAYGGSAVVALAQALATDASWAVRKRAAEVLGLMDTDAAAGRALLARHGDADARVREAVFEALGRRSRDAVGSALLAAARSESHDYPRAAAARSLGRVQAAGAYDALLALLAVESHGDVVRAGALDGMKALGDSRAAGVARTYVDYAWGRGGAQRLRQTALNCVLALEPDSRATHSMLVGLLSDPHRSMRQWAARACGTYGVRAAKGRLRQLADHDPHGNVKNAAKEALKRL